MDILDQAKVAIAQRVIAEENLARKKAQMLSLLNDPVTALPLLLITGSLLLAVADAFKVKPRGERRGE